MVKLVQPDVGGILRTHNQHVVVNDDDGAVFQRLSKAADLLRTLDEQESLQREHRDPLLVRRLARLQHGLGNYCKAAKRPQDATVHLNDERQLLEQLFEQPPQEDGSWRSGALYGRDTWRWTVRAVCARRGGRKQRFLAVVPGRALSHAAIQRFGARARSRPRQTASPPLRPQSLP